MRHGFTAAVLGRFPWPSICVVATCAVMVSCGGNNGKVADAGASPGLDAAAPVDGGTLPDGASVDSNVPEDGSEPMIDGGELPDAATAAICDPAHGPVAPTATADVLYETWTDYPCFADACLCDDAAADFVSGLLRCEAVSGGYWWGLGSLAVRVVGRQDGNCLIDIAGELEGGASVDRCTLPLPLSPWPGIGVAPGGDGTTSFFDGIEEHCTLLGSCCLLPECPNPCMDSPVATAYMCRGGSSTCDP